MAWRTPNRNVVTEQLEGQQVTDQGVQSAQEGTGSQGHPRGQEGGREQKDAKLRVARNAPSSLDCAGQSGVGAAQWAGRASACVERCWMCIAQGRCCVERRRSRAAVLL